MAQKSGARGPAPTFPYAHRTCVALHGQLDRTTVVPATELTHSAGGVSPRSAVATPHQPAATSVSGMEAASRAPSEDEGSALPNEPEVEDGTRWAAEDAEVAAVASSPALAGQPNAVATTTDASAAVAEGPAGNTAGSTSGSLSVVTASAQDEAQLSASAEAGSANAAAGQGANDAGRVDSGRVPEDTTQGAASPKMDFATMMMELVAERKEEEAEEDEFAPTALWCLTETNPLRAACQSYSVACTWSRGSPALRAVLASSAFCAALVCILQQEVRVDTDHLYDSELKSSLRPFLDGTALFINTLFFADHLVQIVAKGFISDHRSFLRQRSHLIEFVLTLSMFVVEGNEHCSWGMALRWLRPCVFLRVLSRVNGLHVLVGTIAEAIPQLSLMLTMAVLILATASIFGVHMWNELFSNKCYPTELVGNGGEVSNLSTIAYMVTRPPFIEGDVAAGAGSRSQLCALPGEDGAMTRQCQLEIQGQCGIATDNLGNYNWPHLTCAKSPTNMWPHEKSLSFDSIGYAFLLMFQVITLSSWSQIMYLVMDVDTSYLAVPFFVMSVVFGAYFLSNLTIAILKARFDSAIEETMKELAAEQARAEGVQEESESKECTSERNSAVQNWHHAHYTVKTVNLLRALPRKVAKQLVQQSKGLSEEEVRQKAIQAQQRAAKMRQRTRSMFGAPTVVNETQELLEADVDGNCKSTEINHVATQSRGACRSLRQRLKVVTDSQRFEYFFISLTVFNTILLMLEFHNQPLWWSQFLEGGNYVCAILFCIELVMRLLAESLAYFTEAFNIFDFFIVVTSILDLFILGSSKVGFSAARSFRILRLFRVLRVFRVNGFYLN